MKVIGQFTKEKAEELLGFKEGEIVRKDNKYLGIVVGLGFMKSYCLNNGGCVLTQFFDGKFHIVDFNGITFKNASYLLGKSEPGYRETALKKVSLKKICDAGYSEEKIIQLLSNPFSREFGLDILRKYKVIK